MASIAYPKRLIEVDLPIKEISAHARREKSIRHGHISTLHIWWARRPLAACRAVICAALWPDPADDLCPQAFRDAVALVLAHFAEEVRTDAALAGLCAKGWRRWNRTNLISLSPTDPACWPDMRYALLDFIADFANWDASAVPAFLDAARILTQVSHLALGDAGWHLPISVAPGDLASTISHLQSQLTDLPRPLVVDPFAGGGAIPLEALRVGADAFASDLNPVAVLLNKVVLEYIPKYGQRLAGEVRKWGQWVKEQAEQELAEFYPQDPDGATPIAYLWARTITCEGPGCGAQVPLMRSFWLGKKPNNSWSLRVVADQVNKTICFDVVRGAKVKDVGIGTVTRGAATCPLCGYTTPVESVRKQLQTRRGGTRDARLVCVVTTKAEEQGRYYRIPTQADWKAASAAADRLREIAQRSPNATSLIPNEPLPAQGTLGFRLQLYGMESWGDLFTGRQALVLVTLADKLKKVRACLASPASDEFDDALQAVLALNIDKMADYGSSLASWSSPASQETVRGTFGRQALPMVWDFAEAYPFAASSGGWEHNLDFLVSPLISEAGVNSRPGVISRTSATHHPLPDDSVDALFTDPPYYDAIPYADLSDYFGVWLKRSLADSRLAADFAVLSPKDEECVVDEVKGHGREFFEKTMTQALKDSRRLTRPGGVGIVVFAHKSTAGWETQLKSLIDSGWIVTGSWPIDTERAGRMRANASAALASSIHLVCRPRETPGGDLLDAVGDWGDVLAELPNRIHQWMPRLASEGIVGADAIFACLGPALEVFSRHARVEKASGDIVTLKEYLEYVWAAVSKEALTMIFEGADATGFEEDARLTAMWLWTLTTERNGDGGAKADLADDDSEDEEEGRGAAIKAAGYYLEYDAARKISQGLGAHLERLASLVEVKGDKARLLPVAERARHLFGKDQGQAPARRQAKPRQLSLLAAVDEAEQEGGWGEKMEPDLGNTVLDRVHQSMILFAAGRAEALRRFLVEEKVGNDQRFWRLAQALSALYPPGSDEKRWVDGVLARKKGLGF